MMSGNLKIAVPVVLADRFYMSERALAEISSLGGYAWAEAKDGVDLADKIGGSPSVQVIVSEYVPVNLQVLGRAPGLKGVIAYGAGYDHIEALALSQKGIKVCNCRGENAQAVAELAFGLLLSLMRRIHRADPWVRQGEWVKAGRALPEWTSGQELWRKTLGVIGLGQIGSRVIRIAKGFDMKILGYDPFINPAHSRALAAVKPGMVLVNTSRGKVIEEEAFIEALRAGRMGGAALDVFATEPLPFGHPLTKQENVVLSPHMGALTQEAGDRLSDSVSRQVRDILEGRPPECLIT